MREFIATYNGLSVLVHATTLEAARNKAVQTYVDCFAICVRSEVNLTDVTGMDSGMLAGAMSPYAPTPYPPTPFGPAPYEPKTPDEIDREAYAYAKGEALMASYRAVGRAANAPKKSIWKRVVGLFGDHEVWF